MEEWKSIVGYEGHYEVSNLGNIRSLDRNSVSYGTRVCTRKGRNLIGYTNKKGYVVIDLCKEGVRKSSSVHRLVAEAFIPNPHERTQVDHIDNNPSNNNVENLRWVTGTENLHNRVNFAPNSTGELHIHSYFKFQVTRNGKTIQKTFATLEEAKAFRLKELGF